MPQCPSCMTSELVSDTVNYPIGDTLVKNVPALTCTCGEIVLAEDVLSVLMKYLQKHDHMTIIEWGDVYAFTSTESDTRPEF